MSRAKHLQLRSHQQASRSETGITSAVKDGYAFGRSERGSFCGYPSALVAGLKERRSSDEASVPRCAWQWRLRGLSHLSASIRPGFSGGRVLGQFYSVVVNRAGREDETESIALMASADIDDDAAATISEIRQSSNGSLSVKLHDPKAALIELGRHFNVFRDRPVTFDLPVIETAADVLKALGAVAAAMAHGELTPHATAQPSGPLAVARLKASTRWRLGSPQAAFPDPAI